MEQRTPEWYAARVGRITASSVGAILGNSPYQTRAGVMRAMVREREGLPSEFPDPAPPPVAWGTANEDTARGEYEMETCHDVELVGFVAVEDWAGCSPDGFVGETGGVEFKCPYGLRADPAPTFLTLAEQPHYYDQVQFTLWCTGRQWWHFYQWTPHGSRLETAYPDHDWIRDNIPRLRQFHAEFLDEPAEEHAEAPRVVVDTPDAVRMLREWDEIAEQMELLEERKKDLLAAIVKASGARNSLVAGRKLTLTKRQGSVSYAKVVKEHCPGVNLEPYRGKASEFWQIR